MLWLSEFNSDLFLRKWKVSFSHRELPGSLGCSVYSLSETIFEPLGLDRLGGNTGETECKLLTGYSKCGLQASSTVYPWELAVM